MRVTFWGTRGSIPVPGKDTTVYGGNTTCVEITTGSGRRIVVDAGTGIRALGSRLVGHEHGLDLHLLITHIHWDHVIGFPFFDPIYDPNTKIAIDGYPSCRKGLQHVFDNKMGDGFFPIAFHDLKAQISFLDTLSRGPLEIDGVSVDTIVLQHPQGGFGFRFREGGKTMVFLTDNELDASMPRGTDFEHYVRFCEGADVLIHDAQYLPEEMSRHRGWGHSDNETALSLALEAGVRRLMLFHHDPSRKDAEMRSIEERSREAAESRSDYLEVDVAREGQTLTL